MKDFFLKIIEKNINRYLTLDPSSQERLQPLKNKIVTLELLGIGLTFQILFSIEGVHLQPEDILVADAHIKGTPLRLSLMALSSHEKRQAFFAEDVMMQGDPEVAQNVMRLFDEMDIDWEEHASQWLGDVPANHLGRIFHKIKSFAKTTQTTFTQNVNEYLHEEILLCPTREELQDFFTKVDVTRMDVDRIAVRIRQLKEGL